MSQPRVITVCKYNQARSITAAAALRRFFPDYQILSAGIQANPFVPIPSSILEILDQWDLTDYDDRSTPVTSLPPLLPTDLVLCADAEVKEKFIEQLHIANPNEFYIRILEEFAHSAQEIPVDPVNMGASDTKTQLARALVLTVRATRQHFGIAQLITSSRFPHDKADHLQAQKQMLSAIKENHGVIIDTGFAIPHPMLWQANAAGLIPFNPNRLELDSTARVSGVLISKFEIDLVPKILLSINYAQWLAQISSLQPVYALAQPASELPMSRHHEAVLSLIHS